MKTQPSYINRNRKPETLTSNFHYFTADHDFVFLLPVNAVIRICY